MSIAGILSSRLFSTSSSQGVQKEGQPLQQEFQQLAQGLQSGNHILIVHLG